MAVTIVDSDLVTFSGVANATITVPAGVAGGDAICIAVVVQRASGNMGSVSISGLTSAYVEEKMYIFNTILAASPPASYTVVFSGVTNAHGLMMIFAVRGFEPFGVNDVSPHKLLTGMFYASISGETLSEWKPPLANSLQVIIAGARGATITLPSGTTAIEGSTYTGPPSLSLYAGYTEYPTTATVSGETIALSAAQDIEFVRMWFAEDVIGSPSIAGWNAIEYEASAWPGAFLFDTAAEKTYSLTYDTSGDYLIEKIDRTTMAVDVSAVLTGKTLDYLAVVDQDATHLYLGNNAPNLLKIAKSDLSLTATGGSVPNASATWGVDRVRIGKGWNSGKVWATQYASSAGNGHRIRLVSWDTATMAIVNNIDLAGGDTAKEAGASEFIIDTTGDIYFQYSTTDGVGHFTVSIGKVNSSLTVSYLATLTGVVYSSDPADVSFLYDSGNEQIVIVTSIPDYFEPAYSRIAIYDIGSNTLLENINYGTLHNAMGYSYNNNGVGTVLGTPSAFIGVFAAKHQEYDNQSYLVQFDRTTLEIVRTIDLPDGYYEPHNACLDPEGRVWMGAWSGGGGMESLLRFNLAEQYGGEGAIEPHILSYGMSGQVFAAALG